MRYKGRNKHSIEELEDIIDSLEEKIIETEQNLSFSKEIELMELVRDIYNSAKYLKSDVIKTEEEMLIDSNVILNAVLINIQKFAKHNNINL